METKTVWQYDQLTNKLVGEVILDETDKGAVGEWLLHGGCVDIEPPANKENFDIYWTGKNWEYREIEKEPEPEKPPELTLVQLKENKTLELKNIRDRKELEPVSYNDELFDFDEKSIFRINEARDMLELDKTQKIDWTTANNNRVVVNYDDLTSIKTVGAIRSNTLHIKYNELKMEILACESKEDLENIKWV